MIGSEKDVSHSSLYLPYWTCYKILISLVPEFRNLLFPHSDMGGDSNFKRLHQHLRRLLSILFRESCLEDPPPVPYGSPGLFQVSSMGRGIPYYYSGFLPSWYQPLPIPIPKFPPARIVGMVTQKPSQPYPGLLPMGVNVHTGLERAVGGSGLVPLHSNPFFSTQEQLPPLLCFMCAFFFYQYYIF